jgi:hypothetical protein
MAVGVGSGRRGDLVGEFLDVFHESNRRDETLSDEVQRLDYGDVWTMKVFGP